MPAFDDDVWELYASRGLTPARNLAAENPEMLHQLQRLWLIEAIKYNVLPWTTGASDVSYPDCRDAPR